MADYYPLIARAVAGLENSTGEARRALYERARTALVAQLRGVIPALSESDITRERLALEESIRKVEAEAARRTRLDSPRAAAAPPPRAEPRVPTPGVGNPAERGWSEAPVPPEPSFRAEPVMPGRRPSNRPPSDRSSLTNQGLKGFRDGVGETDGLGDMSGLGPRSGRDAFPGTPAPFPEPDRIEPRVEPRFDPRHDAEEPPPYRAPPASKPSDGRNTGAARPGAARNTRLSDGYDEPGQPRLGIGIGRKIILVAMAVVVCVAGAFAYRERASIAALYQSMRGPAGQAARDTTQPRGKIEDRIGTGQQDSGSAPAAAVAQRVVLYETQPNSTERKQFIGSVIWRTETGASGPGQPPDLALKADVEIPERRLRMSWTMRRNTDANLPASHTIEIAFSTASDFPPGGVADIPGVLMDQPEQTRGVALTGTRIKAGPGFFLVGLSAVPSDVQRNVQLLKERPWADIPLVYNDGNRALLAIEKGVPGDRAFAAAFAAWGQ